MTVCTCDEVIGGYIWICGLDLSVRIVVRLWGRRSGLLVSMIVCERLGSFLLARIWAGVSFVRCCKNQGHSSRDLCRSAEIVVLIGKKVCLGE